jgi:hypothetical protein
MASCRGDYPLTLMCRVLGVSRPGYSAGLDREPSEQACHRASVGKRLEALFYQFRRRYGSRRLMEELNDEGIACSENYVADLIRVCRRRAIQDQNIRSPLSILDRVVGR